MGPERPIREILPDAVIQVLEEFRRGFDLDVHLWLPREGAQARRLFPLEGGEGAPEPESILLTVATRDGNDLTLEVRGEAAAHRNGAASTLRFTLEQIYAYAEEVRFFTYEVSERYEEINLLYSISETLGSILHLKDAARFILGEVCEVMGARRGSLWVHDRDTDLLDLVASVGAEGLEGPLRTDDTTAVTSRVFREGHPIILTGERLGGHPEEGTPTGTGTDSFLSVPIRYTPPDGMSRTVGVVNLIGRRRGGRFTASDQKLLSAIASQVGSAVENNRLLRESLEQERVNREMELAQDLQMKLLPSGEGFDAAQVAARVQSAESVGGDFYNFFRLPGGRFGVMIGDVATHGFPAALIMALSMSAGAIYATEVVSPGQVLSRMDEALRDELETTEMYLTLFYGVVDPERGELTYANAGHPHAFAFRGTGEVERLEAMDPPMGIAPFTTYQQRTVPWAVGEDLLFLFTDGLSDPLAPASRNRGEARVLERVGELRAASPDVIVDALFRMEPEGVDGGEPGQPVGDDRTAVVIRV